jgi:Flp pilus assembly protein CpaB
MKNIIPLIVSVILGLAAVYIVSKLLFEKGNQESESKVAVVVAASDLKAYDELTQGGLTYKEIPASAVPKNALLWENVSLAYGQRMTHPVAQDDFIRLSDIRIQSSLADCARQGEWTIPVTFSDPALVQMLMPDDEIAIISTYVSKEIEMPKEAPGDSEAPGMKINEARETSVLLPCVRVLGFANSNGNFREGGSSGGTIFVSLPPQQAMILIAAQRESELYPVLRKRNDSVALNRKDGGVVNAGTFANIRNGLVPAELPEIPNKNHQ